MSDNDLTKILFLLNEINDNLKLFNKDNFSLKFFDGLIIGSTSGIISGLIIYLLTK